MSTMFCRFNLRIFGTRREKPLTAKPIRMLILATTDADIKTVGKYWLYRKLWRKMPILVARSNAIGVCGAGDGDGNGLLPKTHMCIFSMSPRSRATLWFINSLRHSPPHLAILSFMRVSTNILFDSYQCI